ncbi:PspC domain-containing protein [Nocardioides sp. YIM 152588]|uniref:PspC domain-containing protein n=1 Tax=Nocardioides sp. YIM 152588 TaxID=3158259 RepID=UPI0032E4A36E
MTAPPPPPGPGQGPRVSTEEMRDLGRLRRSTTNRKIAGVAGGIARHFDIDPVIVRVAFVVLVFFGGGGLLLYAACWLLVPQDDGSEAPVRLDERTRVIALLVVGVIVALTVVGDTLGGWHFPWQLAVVGLIVVAVLARVQRNRQHPGWGPPPGRPGGPGWVPPGTPTGTTTGAPTSAPTRAPAGSDASGADTRPSGAAAPGTSYVGYEPPATPPPPPGTAGTEWEQQWAQHWERHQHRQAEMMQRQQQRHWERRVRHDQRRWDRRQRAGRRRGPILFGYALVLALLATGTLATLQLAGVDVAPSAYPAAVMATCGLMLLVGAFWGRGGGLIAVGLVAALATAALAMAEPVYADRWAGQIRSTPQSAATVQDEYSLGAGEILLDLTEIDDLEELDGRTLALDVRLGHILVTVPEDGLDVRVNAQIDGGGQTVLFGDTRDASNIADHDGGEDVPELTIEADMLFGEIEFETAGSQ